MGKVVGDNLYYQRNKIERKQKLDREMNSRIRRNMTLYILITLLLLMSIINMASSNFYVISTKGLKDISFHILYIFIGMVCFVITLSIDYKKYNENKNTGLLLLISTLMLWFVVIGAKFFPRVVPHVNGAIGWIRIWKFSIQPSELLKLPYVIILAHLLEKAEEEKYTSSKIIFLLLPVVLMFILPILFQKDLGTAIHYMAIFAFMVFMSRFSLKIIVALITAGIIASSTFFYYVYNILDTTDKSYKIQRVVSFLNGLLKNEYDKSFGYQVGQSLLAFGSGGIAGKGYANGVQKYSYLPEIKTDFILACFGEEFGFLGMIGLLICFLLLFNIIKRVAISCKDYFGKYLAIGIGGYILIQMLINIYVALGMLPVFGIPMPLFSYGGTSIITILISLGIILNINKKGYM